MKRDLYLGDNLQILKRLPACSVQAVITDPPFNVQGKLISTQDTIRAEFNDSWHHVKRKYDHKPSVEKLLDIVEQRSMQGYLDMMAYRLTEMRRILRDDGSIFVHCDQHCMHYLKLLMDRIFGNGCYNNNIYFCYMSSGLAPKNRFKDKTDTILFYSKIEGKNKFYAIQLNVNESDFPYTDEKGQRYKWVNKRKNEKTYMKVANKLANWWTDIPVLNTQANIRCYPTQKPEKLYQRLVQCSTDEGDLVIDPFAGSGTTLVAAENMKRQWIGIDQNPDAIEVIEKRFDNLGYGRLFPSIEVHRAR